MAGGLGTRISAVVPDLPKPMIPVCGKPILLHQIECLKKNGITEITIVIGYKGDVIKKYFGFGQKFGVSIDYFVEDYPLGTGGAIFKIKGLRKDFLLLNGDLILDIDFNRLIDFHIKHNALVTLFSHPNGHPYDSSLLVTETVFPDENDPSLPVSTHRVTQWLNKEDERTYCQNRVNAGIQVISPEFISICRQQLDIRDQDRPDKVDLDRQMLKPNISSGRIFCYDSPEYVKDMGTPERYSEVISDIMQGKVRQKNLSLKQKAIFLDRDGVINVSKPWISDPDQFTLIKGAADAVKRINRSGYLCIVVTNQPVIARGECTWQQLKVIHDKLETLLGAEGAYLDAIYVCPHHTDKGFQGERPQYKVDCECRKPKPGLLLQAAEDFNIDLSQSYMIGDSQRDVLCGENAGCKQSFLVPSDSPDAVSNVISLIL